MEAFCLLPSKVNVPTEGLPLTYSLDPRCHQLVEYPLLMKRKHLLDHPPSYQLWN